MENTNSAVEDAADEVLESTQLVEEDASSSHSSIRPANSSSVLDSPHGKIKTASVKVS